MTEQRRTELRPVALGDAATLLAWRNDPGVADFMYTSHRIGEGEHAAWFARLLNDPALEGWIIVVDGVDVGFVNLYAKDDHQQRCYWAFYIADREHGKGAGRAVETALIEHVFDVHGYRKLCCEVLETNERVVRMHERFGFVVEGRLRQHVVKGGTPVDVITLGLLREEWEARRSGRGTSD